MWNRPLFHFCLAFVLLGVTSTSKLIAESPATVLIANKPTSFDGRAWSMNAPRDEIRPRYTVESNAADGERLVLESTQPGQHGWWQTDIPIAGGKSYSITIERRVTNVVTPHRSTVGRIDWLNASDRRVATQRPFIPGVLEGYNDSQQPDYLNEPAVVDGAPPSKDWQVLTGTFTAPRDAIKARLELQLRWCDVGARVEYRRLQWRTAEPTQPRMVKLATIHLCPGGGNPQANREAFAGLIEQAAAAGAQLIVLPETLTYYGTGKTPDEVSEPVPGPTTEYFGALAKKHRVHIVTTCFEKDRYELFNTAMLMGPDGQMIGKYRKVCIPRGEIEAGVTPGTEYPVFETSIGRVGMMICYDGFFPQVAQRLTDAGADVIAFPVWGCNPLLAKARAVENQIYVVSSTYTAPERDWMISAVFAPNGQVAAQAREWGSFAIAEVNLGQPPYWPSLGTHRSERFHHQPK